MSAAPAFLPNMPFRLDADFVPVIKFDLIQRSGRQSRRAGQVSLPSLWLCSAGVVVFFELWAIAYIRARYMDTPFLQAVFQIVLGGSIVLAVGILIGAA